VYTFDSTLATAEGAVIEGSIRGLEPGLVSVGLVVAPLAILVWLGLAFATIVATLSLAALGARQVRQTTALIRREPARAVIWGFLGMIAVPVAAVLLMITLVGLPIGFAVLLFVWPALAFLGYLVTAIWVGEWVVRAGRSGPEPERPYAAALAGSVLLLVLALIPFAVAVLTLFGYGAVLLQGWRVFRGGGQAAAPTVPAHVPTPA
jgi:hypothetical protein